MDKKTEKKTCNVAKYLKCSFWTMIGLLVLLIAFNLLATKIAFFAYIAIAIQILLYISVIFVFVSAIMSLSPEKGFAIIALIISGLVFLLLMLALLVLMSGASTAALG
jgi:hypothetical protein